ncbi:hypothetical protein MRB53_023680 [Persea americana]|uniref:Uncharacterized protein n=1 Tax=Persea americana TaxID=3435 RepID=A0ACC2LA31_PERAE|nr:hypothetical protein MRB53_023680 [Persea americana]
MTLPSSNLVGKLPRKTLIGHIGSRIDISSKTPIEAQLTPSLALASGRRFVTLPSTSIKRTAIVQQWNRRAIVCPIFKQSLLTQTPSPASSEIRQSPGVSSLQLGSAARPCTVMAHRVLCESDGDSTTQAAVVFFSSDQTRI